MPASTPHILLITTDQQRFDTVGPARPPFLRTPHLERLCLEGIRFDRAYAQCPVCVPARQQIMTGQDAFTYARGDLTRLREIDTTTETLPGALRELGYHTSLIGKAHFGSPRIRSGFDEMITAEQYYREMQRSGHEAQPMRHGLGQCEFYPGLATVPEALTLTSWTAEQACEFIRYRRDPSQPFFLWLSFHKPHPPWDPPEPYYSMYRNCEVGLPVQSDWCADEQLPPSLRRMWRKQSDDLISPEVAREARSAYYGLITQVDYNLGRVYQALLDEGLDDDTMILFTSDHGEYLGDHRNWGKSSAHEASAHIPFILRLPRSWGEDRVGLTEDALVTHCDILPTCVRAAGGKVPAWSDGHDLLALVRGESGQSRRYLDGYWLENAYWQDDYPQPDYLSITDGDWKYIWYPEGGREQFFDLQSDPGETCDLAGLPSHREQLAALREELIARQTRRRLPTVQNGELVAMEERPIDLRLIRSRGHYGLHGESWRGSGQPNGDILH